MFSRSAAGRRLTPFAFVAGVALLGYAGWTWWKQRSVPVRPPVERVALLPFENLTGDPAQDWLRFALPELASWQLQGLPDLVPATVRSSGETAAREATRIVHGSWQKSGAGLALTLRVETAATRAFDASSVTPAARPESLLAATAEACSLVRGLSRQPGVTPALLIHSPAAWRAFAEAIRQPEMAAERLAEATAADPRFTLAWIRRLEPLVASGAKAEALPLARQALASVPPSDRPVIEWLQALAAGDRPAASRAAVAWAVAHPADSELQAHAASAAQAGRDFAASAQRYARAVQLLPARAEWWNNAAYAQAYAGDLEAARRSLAEYARLAPGSQNPADSLGEILLMAGRFDEAETAFRSVAQAAPGFLSGEPLRKAAYARLYSGDEKGAREWMQRYWDAHQVPSAALEKAVWLRIAGDRQGGAAALQALGSNPAARLIGSIWNWEDGGPIPPGITVRGPGYAALSRGDFTGAAALFRPQLEATETAVESHLREILAWCAVERQDWAEARKLLAVWPLPVPGDWLQPRHFMPRTLYLRGILAEKENRSADDARRLLETYLQLAGSGPDPFGHAAKARAVLARLK